MHWKRVCVRAWCGLIFFFFLRGRGCFTNYSQREATICSAHSHTHTRGTWPLIPSATSLLNDLRELEAIICFNSTMLIMQSAQLLCSLEGKERWSYNLLPLGRTIDLPWNDDLNCRSDTYYSNQTEDMNTTAVLVLWNTDHHYSIQSSNVILN